MKQEPFKSKGLLDTSDPLGAPAPSGGGEDDGDGGESAHTQAIIDAVKADDNSGLRSALKAFVKACMAEADSGDY